MHETKQCTNPRGACEAHTEERKKKDDEEEEANTTTHLPT